MTIHVFDSAVALHHKGGDVFAGRTSPAYANFIGPYGGITAAQAMQAVMLHPQRLGEPVSLTINFAAAVADGEFEVHARPARTNRSTQHWMIELRQQDQVVGTATVMTAVRRETWGMQEVAMPQVAQPGDVPRGRRAGVEWVHRYDMRFVDGQIPDEWDGRDAANSISRLWMRDEPPRPLDFASLTAMSDVFFPRIWLRRATQTPLGTVTMTVYFHADSALLQRTGAGYLLGEVQGQGFYNGFLDHTGHLWNEAGELLVSTHQLMYYKE